MWTSVAGRLFAVKFVLLSILTCTQTAGFFGGLEDVTSENLYNLLEPKIKNAIETKHLDPSVLSDVTFDYTLLPTIYLYNGNLTGLSQFRNETVKSSWNNVARLLNMEMRLIFPELRMHYQWRSMIGSGHLVYIISNMLMDTNIHLDLESLQLRIRELKFNNRQATTEIAVKSKIVTSILNAVRGRLKGMNNWILNPVTDKMNQALLNEVQERDLDVYELLGIKDLYQSRPGNSTDAQNDIVIGVPNGDGIEISNRPTSTQDKTISPTNIRNGSEENLRPALAPNVRNGISLVVPDVELTLPDNSKESKAAIEPNYDSRIPGIHNTMFNISSMLDDIIRNSNDTSNDIR